MTHDQRGAILGYSLLFFVGGLILGHLITSEVYQNLAIKAKVAHYDPKTGAFKYKIMDEDSSM